jgi:hypothetical protein
MAKTFVFYEKPQLKMYSQTKTKDMQKQIITKAENGFTILHNKKLYIEKDAAGVIVCYINDFSRVIENMKPGEVLRVDLDWELNPVEDAEFEEPPKDIIKGLSNVEDLAIKILKYIQSNVEIKLPKHERIRVKRDMIDLIEKYANINIEPAKPVEVPMSVNKSVVFRKVKGCFNRVLTDQERSLINTVLNNLYYDEETPVATSTPIAYVDVEATLKNAGYPEGSRNNEFAKEVLKHLVYKTN